MYKAAGDAQQRAEPCTVNLLLVLTCDAAAVCLFPTPGVMGKIIDWEVWLLKSPTAGDTEGSWEGAGSSTEAALQDVIAGAASPVQRHVKEILVSHSIHWYCFSAFRFAFILVGCKLKASSAEQLLFVAV